MYSRFVVDLECPQTKNIYFILNAIKFHRKGGSNKPRVGCEYFLKIYRRLFETPEYLLEGL